MELVAENEMQEKLGIEKERVIDSWPFMNSPVPVLIILSCYLYFVLKLGPHLMNKRDAFKLKQVLIFYNAYQVIFSVWLCAKAFSSKTTKAFIFNYSCMPANDKEFQLELWKGAWWYFFSKVVELLDTVFFVLRKKQSQVTFLHVYHHSCTMFFSWCYLKYMPGEQGAVIGFLNSFVHVIMYSYYFIAALGPKYQKYLWWKKYMTWIQLIQFCLMLLYLFSLVVMDCNLPKGLTYFFVGNVVIFLFLFGDFYVKAYRYPKMSNKSEKFNEDSRIGSKEEKKKLK